MTGCFIESLVELRLTDRIRLRVDLPSGPLAVDAQVVYSEPRMGFAVRFVNLSPEAQQRLTMAVERLIAARPRDDIGNSS